MGLQFLGIITQETSLRGNNPPLEDAFWQGTSKKGGYQYLTSRDQSPLCIALAPLVNQCNVVGL